MQLLNLLLFFFLAFIVFYLPGRFTLRISGYKFGDFIITFTSSLIIGISLFLFLTFILSFIKLDYLFNLVIPFALLFEGKKSYLELKEKVEIRKIVSPEYLLIIIGSLSMSYLTLRSGLYDNGKLVFYGINSADSLFNTSLIYSLISGFPPVHPGLAGVPLRGYHIFYDFLIAEFSKFYHLNVFDLFFRDFALFISVLYGISSLSLGRFLKWKNFTLIIFIILMYFAQSFDFYAYYIYRLFNYYYNSAGIMQSIANMLDPTVIISVGFFFIGFILLFSKGKKWAFFLPALIIGILPEVKIYPSIIFYTGFGIIALWDLYKKRNFQLLKTFILSGIISSIVFLPINFGAGSLVFAPFLIYKNFIDSAWIFNNWHWNVNFPIYVQSHNYIHIAFFYAVAIFIFLFTSLGIRVVVFLKFKKLFSKKFYSLNNIFWLTTILISFIIPSLFVQSSSTFQNIQFFWAGYIILLVPTAYVIGNVIDKNRKLFIISLVIFFVLFFPDFFKTFMTYSIDPTFIDSGLVEKTKIIRNLPSRTGIIVINRPIIKGTYETLYSSPLIAGISGHPVYYEEEIAQFQGLNNVVDKRKMIIDKIAENMVNCSNPKTAEHNIINLMEESNNQYLLLLKKNTCADKFIKLKLINGKGESALYKI